jgi:hypothetical protein
LFGLPCRTGHNGNSSAEATTYAFNRFKDAMRVVSRAVVVAIGINALG